MPAPDWSLLLRTPAFETTALLLGLVVGSFANVCIHRLPAPRVGRLPALALPGLRRPHPGPRQRPGRWAGSCSAAGAVRAAPRSRSRYPAVEAANGLLWLALAALGGPQPRRFVAMALVTALLVLGLIDLEHQILPDVITLPGIAVGPRARASCRARASRRSPPLAAAAGGWLAFAAVAKAYERAARDRGARAGRLEDGRDARGLPRLAGDAAGRAPRLGGGHRRRPRRDRAPGPRHDSTPCRSGPSWPSAGSRSSSRGRRPGLVPRALRALRWLTCGARRFRLGLGSPSRWSASSRSCRCCRAFAPSGRLRAPRRARCRGARRWRPGRRLDAALAAGGERSWDDAASLALSLGLANEVERARSGGARGVLAPRDRARGRRAAAGRAAAPRRGPPAQRRGPGGPRACGRSSLSGCRAAGGARPFAWPRPRPTSTRSCASGSRSSWATWPRCLLLAVAAALALLPREGERRAARRGRPPRLRAGDGAAARPRGGDRAPATRRSGAGWRRRSARRRPSCAPAS